MIESFTCSSEDVGSKYESGSSSKCENLQRLRLPARYMYVPVGCGVVGGLYTRISWDTGGAGGITWIFIVFCVDCTEDWDVAGTSVSGGGVWEDMGLKKETRVQIQSVTREFL